MLHRIIEPTINTRKAGKEVLAEAEICHLEDNLLGR